MGLSLEALKCCMLNSRKTAIGYKMSKSFTLKDHQIMKRNLEVDYLMSISRDEQANSSNVRDD